MSAGLAQGLILLLGIGGVAYLYNKHVRDIKKELLIAAAISFTWVLLSGLYTYREANYALFGFNLFPFVAWTAGLVALREIYESIQGKGRFLIITVIHVFGIIILEYIGYNWWGIQLGTNYTGLLGHSLMHMPWWGQLYYLSIGPLYIKLTDAMKVK